ncbi:uncharacterized protein LOC130667084 [Microplitis mediator]|uniref:uncharacterized protein LOC130667084 n=1 Tax=Microplitis mediator TaxID=375433 RepID=UPI0025523A73|nr:uncharacterized protein LOC130667084 [Microplitis mediator]
MEWIQKFIWWIMIITVCSGNKIFDKFESEYSSISWNQMGELIKLCFADRTNPIVITKDLIDLIYESSRDIDHPSVNIIDSNYKAKNIQIFNPAYPTYILSAQSTDELGALLDALKLSPTWSVTSVFFIIGITEKSCGGASKMLQILWKLDLISSYFVCHESDNDEIMMLYTYNPFTNQAPEPWVEVETFDKPDNQWTLYKQPYSNDKNICRNLTFDKTKFLNGHTVKAAINPMIKTNCTHNKVFDIKELGNVTNYFVSEFSNNLFLYLNVTPVINYGDAGSMVNNTAVGFLKTLMNGTHDIVLSPRRFGSYYEQVDIINFHFQVGHMILTQRMELVSIIKNFKEFLSFEIIAVTILILFITFIIIIFKNGNDYSRGFLDILRLSLSAGISAPLNSLSVRVIFFVTTLYVFIMSPFILGQILALSVKPDHHYPENLKDLRDFKYNVYYHEDLKPFISDQELWLNLDKKYLHRLTEYPLSCHDQVLNDSLNACVTSIAYQIIAAYKYNLHLAQEKLDFFYVSYLIRKNWILKSEIDKLALRFSEHGLIDCWNKREFIYRLNKLKVKEALKTAASKYDGVEFENLLGVYIFMALSFVFTVLIFVAEILIKKFQDSQHRKIIIKTLEKKVAFVGGRLIPIKQSSHRKNKNKKKKMRI